MVPFVFFALFLVPRFLGTDLCNRRVVSAPGRAVSASWNGETNLVDWLLLKRSLKPTYDAADYNSLVR